MMNENAKETPEPFRPVLRTVQGERLHLKLSVQFEKDGPVHTCCGDSWCVGDCGLPALVLSYYDPDLKKGRELKAYSNMVACGRVMQGWRGAWKGERVQIPAEHHADFMKRMWW